MANTPETPHEHRVKIVPAANIEPINRKHLGRRAKFGGRPDDIRPGNQSEIRRPVCGRRLQFVEKIDSFESNGKDKPNRKEYSDTQFMFDRVGMIYPWFRFNRSEPLATMDCS
jgi:hypothetical protein